MKIKQPTALCEEHYDEVFKEILKDITTIVMSLKAHKKEFKKIGDWSYCGELNHIKNITNNFKNALS